MEKEIILKLGNEILNNLNPNQATGYLAQAKELIKSYCGKNNAFYEELDKLKSNEWKLNILMDYTSGVLRTFLKAIEKDLISGASYERKIKSEVINDFLIQAETFLNTKEFHPATAAMLIGASLEEFLRNWIDDQNIILGKNKPGINSYAALLREKDFITKQDFKDINSWSGLRNHAAHGEWDEVDDRKRIILMLEGVNIFMKKYEK